MNLSSLESFYSSSPLRSKKPKSISCLFWGILFLVVFSTACGKHRVQARPPAPQPAPEIPSPDAESATQLPPTIQQESPLPFPSPGVGPVEAPGPGTQATAPAAKSALEPLIRIGLVTGATDARISSAGDYFVMDKMPEASRQLLHGEVRIRIERQGAGTDPVYQIQVASFSHPENAEAMKEKLSKIFDVPVSIHKSSASGTNQVRVGEFLTKEDAQAFLKTMNGPEYRRAYIVTETSAAAGGKAVLALRGSNGLFKLTGAGFLFLPSSATGFLCVNGKPYRGSLDVVLNKKGMITIVNQVGVEEYLLGVVPAEISPTAYPEYEGLAALSIASRTYALYHRGQFGSEGFDLTDDTRTQVYGGVNAEKAATDKAVQGTRGLAIYYHDKLIDAMYMSTCGGRTEDFSNVYDAPSVPYLKSVFCAIEGGPAKGEAVLEGGNRLAQVILTDDGSVANRNLELARILGLVDFDSRTPPEFFTEQIKRDEAVRLIENARKAANRAQAEDPPAPADVNRRAGFLKFAAEEFFGADEIKQRISLRDVDYYTANLEDGNAVSESARYALSYLMQAGLWNPNPDNTVRPDAPVRRCDAISLLLRWVESVRPDILRQATFVEALPGKDGGETDAVLEVKRGSRTQEIPLSKAPSLFRLDSGRPIPIRSLRIIGNEKLAFHVSSSGRIDFLETELNPTGASSDRYSPAATWNVTFTRSDLEKKLHSLADSIGSFIDMKPSAIGNSGRVIKVQAIGSRGSVVLNGYRVRNALGLKDTLYTIARELNPDGSIANFTFSGRGFGHGIGLCQVGAFGMARAGRSHEEILKTYYTGVEIKKAY